MEWLRRRSARQQFDEFVVASGSGLVRTAYLMTWDLAESEDLVQETFLRVARRWDRVRTMDHPLAYARRILVNLALDGSRRRRRRRDELVTDDPFRALVDERAAAALRAVDDLAALRDALATLPRQERAVLALRYWEDLPEREIARILGCSAGTVKKTASRAMTRLRRTLPPPATAALIPSTRAEGSAP